MKFLGHALHDLLHEIGVFDAGTLAVEHVRITARKGERCRVMYRAGNAEDWVTSDLAWEPLLEALIATGTLGHPTYCRAFTIDAPRDKPCTITYEYFADQEPLFAGLRAARITQNVAEAMVR